LGGETVVCATSDADVRSIVRTAEGARRSVIELEECPRRAPPAELVNKGALLPVAVEDFTSHASRYVARPRTRLRRRARLRCPTVRSWRSLRLAEALSFELLDEQVEGALDDR